MVYTLLKGTDDTKSGGKLLILFRVRSYPDGPEQAGRMVRQVTSEIKQGKMLSTGTGKEEDLNGTDCGQTHCEPPYRKGPGVS